MVEFEFFIKLKFFLCWVGGKIWFLKEIEKFLFENGFNNYVELFIGGGLVFFYLNFIIVFFFDLNF